MTIKSMQLCCSGHAVRHLHFPTAVCLYTHICTPPLLPSHRSLSLHGLGLTPFSRASRLSLSRPLDLISLPPLCSSHSLYRCLWSHSLRHLICHWPSHLSCEHLSHGTHAPVISHVLSRDLSTARSLCAWALGAMEHTAPLLGTHTCLSHILRLSMVYTPHSASLSKTATHFLPLLYHLRRVATHSRRWCPTHLSLHLS